MALSSIVWIVGNGMKVPVVVAEASMILGRVGLDREGALYSQFLHRGWHFERCRTSSKCFGYAFWEHEVESEEWSAESIVHL